jgi:hypothetical protein
LQPQNQWRKTGGCLRPTARLFIACGFIKTISHCHFLLAYTHMNAGASSSSPLLCLLFQPRDDAIAVVHPLFTKLGPLWLNRSAMLPTSGMERSLRRNNTRPASVCLLFQRKRCTAGVLCNQIHIQQHYMKRIQNALQCPVHDECCCNLHTLVPQNLSVSQGRHFELCGIAREDNPSQSPIWISVPIAMTLIAHTVYWEGERFTISTGVFHAHRVVPLHDVCEGHQRGVCENGKDCKKVHICRRVWLSLQTTFHIPWDDAEPQGYDNPDDAAPELEAEVTPWTMIGRLSDVLVGVTVE